MISPEPLPSVPPGTIDYEVVVTATIREILLITSSKGPQNAANRASDTLKLRYPNARIEVHQVDYRTEHGGESHWYPND